jgi:ribonucleoside-triphosphate reductase (formate)
MKETATWTNLAYGLAEPKEVVKRSGSTARFDGQRIFSSIYRAGQATGEFGTDNARHLARQVVLELSHVYGNDIPGVESIQDLVEKALYNADFFKTMRAYIVYREQHKALRKDQKTIIDVANSVNEYLKQTQTRVIH